MTLVSCISSDVGCDVTSDIYGYVSSDDCSDVSINVESDVGSWKWLERYALSP